MVNLWVSPSFETEEAMALEEVASLDVVPALVAVADEFAEELAPPQLVRAIVAIEARAIAKMLFFIF